MSDMLTIGASGARAYQRALATVSTNIANAENPDYVRRDLRLGELAIDGGFRPLQLPGARFGGVDVSGLQRAHDPFLEANTRLTGAALYSAETRVRFMGEIENALDDGEQGIGAQFSAIFSTGEELAAAPFDMVLRTQFLSQIDEAVAAFRRTDTSLAAVSERISGLAEQEVRTFNAALSDLAEVNIGLRSTTEGSARQMNLLDRRDAALATISERADVRIDFGNRGAANLSLGGETLVDIGQVRALSVSANADGTLAFAVEGATVTNPAQGSLAALASSANSASQQRTELTALAQNFVTAVNDWQASGTTDAGGSGAPLLAMGVGVASLSLLTRDPAALALASNGAANGNALQLAAVRTTSGVEANWTNIVGSHAAATAAAQAEQAAAASQFDAARQARDSLSSVDLDREAADLVRLQQAYDASARVVQVARETMQSIFAIF